MYKKLIQSGRQIEIFNYQHEPLESRQSSTERAILRAYPNAKVAKDKPRKSKKHSAHRRRDNVHRLRKNFNRIVISNFTGDSKPQLATFTFASIVDLHAGYIEWRKFVQRLRSVYGKDFKFIAVPEFQDRGSVHFHALIWGLPYDLGDKYTKFFTGNKKRPYAYRLQKRGKERAHHKIQQLWGFGFVDIRQTDGSPALAHYISKYLVKTQFDDRTYGKKAYITSRNIQRPRVLKGASIVDHACEILELSYRDLVYSDRFDTIFLGSCQYDRFNT